MYIYPIPRSLPSLSPPTPTAFWIESHPAFCFAGDCLLSSHWSLDCGSDFSSSASSSCRLEMESPPITASGVGSFFVQHYYRILQQSPESGFQFYKDSSTMTRAERDTQEFTASSIMDIHSILTSLNYTGIEISNLKCQDSLNGSVLVMVSGYAKSTNFSGRRTFTQVFFLAPQEQGQSYFVLNDIFEFTDEIQVDQQPPLEAPVFEIPDIGVGYEVHSSRHVDNLEEETREYINAIQINEDSLVGKYSMPDEQQEEPVIGAVVEEPYVEHPPPLQSHVRIVQDTMVGTVNEPVEKPSRFTYASILRTSKAAVDPRSNRKSTPVPSEHRKAQTTAPPLNPSTSSFSPKGADDGAVQEEGEFTSVYVRNLPSDVTAQDLEREFKNFGRIKPDGIFIRNRKDVGVCFAFVEFEDVVGVQNAIQASTIQLLGREIYIEERRASSNSVSRGGGVGRGRGRGRGSYNRARGNGYHQHGYDCE